MAEEALGGSPATERQRVQVEFSPEAYARLQEIKALADKRTNAEVVRDALRVYEWLLRQKKQGYRFQLAKGDTVREVEFAIGL